MPKQPEENKSIITSKEVDSVELARLRAENDYLKMENEYLKKLNALVQKRQAQQKKKK